MATLRYRGREIHPEDILYIRKLIEQHPTDSRRKVYRLRATRAEPDYALTVAADRFTLTPGKPLDIPVTVERRNGFDGERLVRRCRRRDRGRRAAPPAGRQEEPQHAPVGDRGEGA